MSMAEIERYIADLQTNAALKAAAAKAEAERPDATPVEVVAFAARNGYAFTVIEMAEYGKNRAAVQYRDNIGTNGELTDAELDAVAGGGSCEDKMVPDPKYVEQWGYSGRAHRSNMIPCRETPECLGNCGRF